jgi:hypothetical protein
MTISTAATADLTTSNSFARRAEAHRQAAGTPDTKIMVRTLDVSALTLDDSVTDTQIRVPAFAIFDDIFAAFTHGTLLSGSTDPVAVEDVRPGDVLQTHNGQLVKVLWVVSSVVDATREQHSMRLTRVMADSFGIGRPQASATFGPAARILQTPHHLRGSQVGAPLLTPIAEFADGMNVIEVTPPVPVRLFHIGLERHAVINAGGMLMESFHPDLNALQSLSQTMRSVYMSVFPHISQLSGFGPLSHTRAPNTQDDRGIA